MDSEKEIEKEYEKHKENENNLKVNEKKEM